MADLTKLYEQINLRRRIGPEAYRALMATKREARAAEIAQRAREIREANDA